MRYRLQQTVDSRRRASSLGRRGVQKSRHLTRYPDAVAANRHAYVNPLSARLPAAWAPLRARDRENRAWALRIAQPGASQAARKPGCNVAPEQGGFAMELRELDRLGDEIALLSAHLEAATARLLALIGQFDAEGGWNNGFRSCAHWLCWRVGLDLGAAREKVRVARALAHLPRLAHALARGELSYAKVRALTRVATPETEERLLAVGRAGTAEHIERIVRGWRYVDRKAEVADAVRRHAGRALHVYQDDDGMVRVRGRLAPEVGALLTKALDAARETLYQQSRMQQPATVSAAEFGGDAEFAEEDVSAETPTFEQQQADALAL